MKKTAAIGILLHDADSDEDCLIIHSAACCCLRHGLYHRTLVSFWLYKACDLRLDLSSP